MNNIRFYIYKRICLYTYNHSARQIFCLSYRVVVYHTWTQQDNGLSYRVWNALQDNNQDSFLHCPTEASDSFQDNRLICPTEGSKELPRQSIWLSYRVFTSGQDKYRHCPTEWIVLLLRQISPLYYCFGYAM